MTTDTTNDAKNQARAQLDTLTAMIERLNHANKCDGDEECSLFQQPSDILFEGYHDEDAARQAIDKDALSVEVRSDWHSPGDHESSYEDVEYNILLCTGGPAVRITGQLDQHSQPDSAVIEYQDWGTPWTELQVPRSEELTMIKYAQQFYFGD